MGILSYCNTLYYLLLTDLKIFKRTIQDKIIDLLIWIVTVVLVTAYLMPAFGLEQSYSSFMIASLTASAGLFEMYTGVTNLITDFEGNNITSFYLILPIPTWLVFIRNILFYAFNNAVLGILVLPISKLLLWHQFDLSQFSLVKFLIIFSLTNIFYATFTIWITSRISSIEQIGSVWMRFVYPLWYLGGFQYSWQVLYNFNYFLGYLSLINPMIYIMEGTRATILGQEGSLPFWLCAFFLGLASIIFGWHGIIKMKRKLDF
ncbi:MAG: ABC transporter permease [Candidatus Babeliales bacterium]